MAKVRIKKSNKMLDEVDLNSYSKDELIARLKSLHAENIQLKNIISRSNACTAGDERKTKSFDFTKCSFRRILLKFYYLGWDYQGFVVQDDTTNTIEYHIFEALTKSCCIPDRKSANYHRCGRTDKGVSAFGQVISLDIRSKLTKENHHDIDNEIDYCKILNRLLPDNIRCIAWSPVEETFSARFDCTLRSYKYFFPRGNLNIQKMRIAADNLLGTHDFRNFCKMDVGNGVVEFTRNIQEVCIEPCIKKNEADTEYTMYTITIIGQAFLWHQIRCIMGVLFLIGQEKEVADIVLELLDVKSNPRKPDYNMASEVPLILYNCSYKDDLTWKYDQESLGSVINKLRESWTFSSIKTNMMRKMLEDLEAQKTEENKNKCLTEFLIDGVRSKTYIPLMKRQRCKSLEDKIEHFAKRSRIEITQTPADNV